MNLRQFPPNFNESYARMYPEKCKDTGSTIVKNVTFVVTEDCNLRCTYCYEHNKSRRRMTEDIARCAVDMLFEEERRGRYITPVNSQAIVLEFIGGEPLLEIDLMDYAVEYFKYRAVCLNHRWAVHHMISISTNGVLYETEKVQQFLERNRDRVSITISIDGNRELHDSCRKFPDGSGCYDIVEKAFKKYLSTGGYKATKLTLAPQNIMHLFEACKHLYFIGLQDIFANCVFEKGWEVEHARIFYRELRRLADYLLEDERYTRLSNTLFDVSVGQPMKETDNRNWCGGTGEMLAIGPDGFVYPCLRYMPFSLQPVVEPVVLGDVWNGLETTGEQRNAVRCLNCITRRSQSSDECFNCPIASGCAWCSAYNYQETGTPDKRVTYICLMHRARVLGNIYFWNRLYRRLGVSDRFEMSIPEGWAAEITGEEETSELKVLAGL